MTRTRLFVAATVLALVAFAGSAGHAQESPWSIRLNGTWTLPDTPYIEQGPQAVRLNMTTGETFGLALSGEYRFSDRFGLEVGVQAFNDSGIVIKLRDPAGGVIGDGLDGHPEDDMRFTLLDAALNIYIVSGPMDLYIGPVVGYFYNTDLVVRATPFLVPAHIGVDGSATFGAVLGLDAEFADSPWFLTASLKYLQASFDYQLSELESVTSSQDIDFDPFIIRLGLGYRF